MTVAPRSHRVRSARRQPCWRGWPVLVLLVLGTVIAEFEFGTTSIISGNPGQWVTEVLEYGCGGLVIRETARRRGIGWPGIVLLGMAYGTIEEGVAEPDWFLPQNFSHPYGVIAGFFTTYAVWNVIYHAVFSITIPILLTEMLFSSRRDQPWLGWPGITVCAVLYGLATIVLSVTWFSLAEPHLTSQPAHRSYPWTAVAGLAAGILAIAGCRLRPHSTIRSWRQKFTTPSPVILGIFGFVVSAGWFVLLRLATAANLLGQLPPVILLIAAAAWLAGVAVLITGWTTSGNGWTERHSAAAITGALLPLMGAGYFLGFTHVPSELAAKAVLNVIGIVLLVVSLISARGRGQSFKKSQGMKG